MIKLHCGTNHNKIYSTRNYRKQHTTESLHNIFTRLSHKNYKSQDAGQLERECTFGHMELTKTQDWPPCQCRLISVNCMP